tara:strand:+ start:534 stop:800 length:267 start_codon:yes stop_codon:yes gene_type:complete
VNKMTWKNIIKNTAGRKNPDDFKEYGEVTPMDISEKEKGDKIKDELEGKIKARNTPLTEEEEKEKKRKLLIFRNRKAAKKKQAERESR